MLQKLNTKRTGFTLVEIMIVVAIIALLAAIAVPNFLRSRKRSQATQVLEDLRQIASAVDLYAIDTSRSSGFTADWSDVQKYIKTGTRLYGSSCEDLFGYYYGSISSTGSQIVAGFFVDGTVTFNALAWNALSDVAPAEFWSPYTYQ